jgi:enoyl-CoA hydratase
MEFETIIYSKQDRIGTIQLNRPRSLNALNAQLLGELKAVVADIEQDPEVGVVIITGHQKFFAAGADIKEISGLDSPVKAHAFVTVAQSTFNSIESLSKPVIAAVSGLALGGGCELALACDIRLAADNARFGQPEIKIGVIPGGGGTQRLPRIIGLGRAKELLFTGEPINAAEAYRVGLVNRVLPVDELMEAAVQLAQTLLKQPPFALGMTKMAVNDGANMDLASALAHEARCFALLFGTKDQKEGMAAFIEKRPPDFKGN